MHRTSTDLIKENGFIFKKKRRYTIETKRTMKMISLDDLLGAIDYRHEWRERERERWRDREREMEREREI